MCIQKTRHSASFRNRQASSSLWRMQVEESSHFHVLRAPLSLVLNSALMVYRSSTASLKHSYVSKEG